MDMPLLDEADDMPVPSVTPRASRGGPSVPTPAQPQEKDVPLTEKAKGPSKPLAPKKETRKRKEREEQEKDPNSKPKKLSSYPLYAHKAKSMK